MQPFFSIIIPHYERPKLLERCLDSIILQEKIPIEVIIIDDNSPSETDFWRVVQSFEKKLQINKNSIVSHFHRLESNAGLPAVPRNFGLSLATGQYLCFLDCDDYLVPKALERVREHLTMYPELVLSGFDVFVVDEQATNQFALQSNGQPEGHPVARFDTLPEKFVSKTPFKLCATFFKSDAWLAASFNEERQFRGVEDYLFTLEFLIASRGPFTLSQDKVACYNLSPDGIGGSTLGQFKSVLSVQRHLVGLGCIKPSRFGLRILRYVYYSLKLRCRRTFAYRRYLANRLLGFEYN